MVADEITLQKVSISRIKQEMRDVYYLSDDLVIASFDIHRDTLGNYPALIDGFSAIIMASGSAVVAIDTEEYEVVPDTIVFISPARAFEIVKELPAVCRQRGVTSLDELRGSLKTA